MSTIKISFSLSFKQCEIPTYSRLEKVAQIACEGVIWVMKIRNSVFFWDDFPPFPSSVSTHAYIYKLQAHVAQALGIV